MHGNSARGNRETPSTPIVQFAAGRLEKAMSRKSSMHVDGESDGCVVPMKCPNNGGKPSAEGMEGRRPVKENIVPATAPRTQSRISELSDLNGVRKVAHEGKRTQFTALLHHVTVGLLRDSYYALKRDAAPGVDGLTWKEYETELEPRLAELHSRVHLGAYRAQPSKRAYISKADGRQRPLGIAALEDKIVQQALAAILNRIYEEDFMGFSYGFRPGRSQMAEGGSIRGRELVEDRGRDSARSGDLAAAGEHLSALRLRSMGQALAKASGCGRHGRYPLRR
jgi:hypothetical protein